MKTAFQKLFTSPLLWGGLLSFGFYFLIHNGLLNQPLIVRYFAGHPVEYITTIMFFIGVAVLGIKYLHVLSQRHLLRQSPILEPAHKVDVRYADHYLDSLIQYEKKHGSSILTRRLQLALNFVRRCGSAEELDTELRYLSDEDAAKADTDYGLVRLILWAVPMLGFLGTVIGITAALDSLDLNTINESSRKLSEGLAVAFDTTGLAIALDVALFFIQFVVYREENNLIWETDKLTDNELRGRFELGVSSEDNGQLTAVRRMIETVINSLEQLTARQSKIWEQSMSVANQRFSQLTEQNAEILKKSLLSALDESLSHHAQSLVHAESQLINQARETTLKFSDALKQNAAGLLSLQEETVRQTVAVRDVIGTSTQLVKLEERLHENLAALAQVGNFEETVNSLAATIHLLNGRHHFGEYKRA
ncbi:MAG: MotA/TolQ/ExbB proton channel family protein [Planctomycetaceae bacterium]|nr:MotA/TolQ/ExbB proton channel family protein [Planctomycetaceae bacterium]